MLRLLEQPTDSLSISAEKADALIARGSGDAALLYLYLLRHAGYFDRAEVLKATGWEPLRLDSALLHLQELHLAGPERPGQVLPEAAPEPLTPDNAPEYSSATLTEALEQPDAEFAQLLHLVEGALGRKLSTRDLRLLYELLDYLSLPAEVILTLVNWQIAERERQQGPGARPNMTTIRGKAYYWKKIGIATQEDADRFLQKQALQRTRIGELLSACGIHGRAPTDGERRYLEQWITRAYPLELVAYAYDITATNTGRFSWAYCNRVLENWYEKKITTLEQAKAEKSLPRRRKSRAKTIAPAPAAPRQEPTAEELERQAKESAEQAAWIEKLIAEEYGASGSENGAS